MRGAKARVKAGGSAEKVLKIKTKSQPWKNDVFIIGGTFGCSAAFQKEKKKRRRKGCMCVHAKVASTKVHICHIGKYHQLSMAERLFSFFCHRYSCL